MEKIIDDLFIIFNSHFDRDKGLDKGRLSLCSLSGGTLDIWLAASSYSTKQYPESFHHFGGYLPPEYRVPSLNNWLVDTIPIDLTHVKGVNGNFYRISPHKVITDKGGVRSDFGIHLDANVEGSMGCIVMNQKRFDLFEAAMLGLRNNNIHNIPLFVRYS